MIRLKSPKAVIFGGLALGSLLLLACIVMTPSFVESHLSSTGTLPRGTMDAIRVLRTSAICVVMVALLAANLISPSRVNKYFDSVSRVFSSLLGRRLQTRRYYLSFCLACSLIALTLCLILTASGARFTYDSVEFMTAGENLYHGNGFVQFSQQPFTHYPLYPVLIAGFMHLGFGAEQAASLIPILSFALLMFPLFFLGKTINGVSTGYAACLMVLVFLPLLRLASTAGHSTPSVLLSAVAILFLTIYAKSDGAGTRILCAGALFTVLAILTSFAAVPILPVALIVIVVKNRDRLRKAIPQVLLFGSISCLPIIPWLYHNVAVSGKMALGFPLRETGRLEALQESVEAITDIMLSNFSVLLLGLAVMACCLVVLAIMKVSIVHRAALKELLRKNYVVISYIVTYVIMLAANGVIFRGYAFVEHKQFFYIYPFILLLGVSFIFYAYRQLKGTSLRPTFALLTIVLLASFLAPKAYASLSLYQDQVISNPQHWYQLGDFNSPLWRNQKGIAWVVTNVPDDATLYSDHVPAAVFRLGRDVYSLPESASVEELHDLFEKLGNEENSFILCFKSLVHWATQPTNNQIAKLNEEYDVLEVVADFPLSTIWRVRSTWVSPTGYDDPDAKWAREENAYDDDTGTFARNITWTKGEWGGFLELRHSAINCTKVRWWLSSVWTVSTFGTGTEVDVDVYYSGAWHDVYEGALKTAPYGYDEVSFGEQSVTRARLRVKPGIAVDLRLKEFDFGQEQEYMENAMGGQVIEAK